MNNNGGRPERRPDNRQRQANVQNSGINISYNTISLVVILAMLLVNFRVFSMIITSNDTLEAKIAVPEISYEEQRELDRIEAQKKDIEQNFIEIPVTFEDTKKGNLILVNSTHEYIFDAVTSVVKDDEAVTIPDSKDGSYWVKSNYDLLKPEALENVDRLLCDFALEKGAKDVMILDTYRTFDDQVRVLNNKITELGEEEGRKIATEPGFSEHHTCLAIDFTRFNGSEYSTYDGKGDYAWISENCDNYGFIIRYPEGKTAVTGINYEPWHLRYVGKEHAYYMSQNGLTLEEYIVLLSQHTVDGKRLEFSDEEGNAYSVYSCVIDGEQGTVLVPKNGSYTISGDNDGRIIVTCKISV